MASLEFIPVIDSPMGGVVTPCDAALREVVLDVVPAPLVALVPLDEPVTVPVELVVRSALLVAPVPNAPDEPPHPPDEPWR